MELTWTTEDDISFPLEQRRRAEDILVRNKSDYYIQVFSGVSHGFATHGNPDEPKQRASLTVVFLRSVLGG